MKLMFKALKSNFFELEKPYKLTFAITYRCQSRCLTCNIWQMKPINELTLNEISEFANKNKFFDWIEITGGEPFLRSDIVEIIKAFNDSNKLYLLTIPTNSLTNVDLVKNRIEAILKLNIPRVAITLSLDGYKELHDKIRGIKGNYDKVMGMARMLHELQSQYKNLYFFFGYTISRYNEDKLIETINAVMSDLDFVSYNNFHVNVAQISSHYYKNENNEIIGSKDKIRDAIKFLMKHRKRSVDPMDLVEQSFLKYLIDYVETGKSPMRSRALDASLFLDSYGDVYPSIMWNVKIGNIRNTNYELMPIWKSPIAMDIREKIRKGIEPDAWTACEAYQTLIGNVKKMIL